ncbi:MAG: thermonuclease family protein [Gemmatimonadales bacterium]
MCRGAGSVRTLWPAIAVTAAAALGAQAPVEREIRAEVARYVAAVNGGDPRALADLYVPAAGVARLGDGHITRGWPGIRALLDDVYRQHGGIAMTVDSVNVAPVGDSAVLAFFGYVWRLGDGREVRGAMTLVYVRTSRGWAVMHDHTSTRATGAAGVRVPDNMVRRDSALTGPGRETSHCRVARVVDGDTFECRTGLRVRLTGVDAPERSQGDFGAAAAEALARLIPVGAEGLLERDVELTDRYGRRLAYVWRDSVLVNWAMVRNGWALVTTYPPNVQYVERFEEAQRLAREASLGLWGAGGFSCAPADRRRGRCD